MNKILRNILIGFGIGIGILVLLIVATFASVMHHQFIHWLETFLQ